MREFERTYQIDPSRERHDEREMHPSIELTDREHLHKVSPRLNKEPELEEPMSQALKEKFQESRKLPKPTNVIDSRGKDEKSKSKSPKSKPKKNNTKSNKPTMAKI